MPAPFDRCWDLRTCTNPVRIACTLTLEPAGRQLLTVADGADVWIEFMCVLDFPSVAERTEARSGAERQ